jgi:threonine dehydratase
MKVTVADIEQARDRIHAHIHHTPFIPFEYLSRRYQKDIWLKCESLQKTGSFKMRGATNAVLSNLDQAKRAGVIAASAGNHAQGVAAICHALGIDAHIVMPTATPPLKVKNTKNWGAEVILHGVNLDESIEQARKLSAEKGYLLVHAYKDAQVIAGQGTAALELLEEKEFDDCEAIVIPVGGGGFSSGIATVLKAKRPKLKIYCVTAKSAPTFYESYKAQKIVAAPTQWTQAEGVATKTADEEMLKLLSPLVDKMFSLGEETIAEAIAISAEHGKLILEGSGALPVGAILEGLIPEKRICLCLTGGNIDIPALSHVLHRGMVEQGRMVRLLITISDRPGGLHAVTSVLAEKGASILQVFHQRSTLRASIGETEIEVDLETRGKEHTEEIIDALKAKKFKVACVS